MQIAFRKAHLSVFAVLALTLAPLSLSAQQGREESSPQVHFSAASLCGNYGAIATYGPNVARALGFEAMDGHGNITAGAAVVNQPGPNNTRTLSSIGISGTYTINAEGIGTMTLTIALPSGATASVVEDFVVTRSRMVDGVAIATEIQDMQEVPSAVIDDASLVIHSYTLRGTPKACGH